ncbi:hypothetical protein FA09DRAFT_177813 [Tilletiopsis washingtonensis]|uniref:Transmembrane protein n=1 Tax=Tilletiopsis washingtonensis TaxID=58919 RepID=A0A316Z0L4_9BASI|nr:hypothetical protein FA09DRAFT_177813 [Tilletiopsis washingtonensis]PWN94564.1 hypothetical protein FA09DRAFT_177813 [Tilletiopsis washingtonensis]
MPALQARQALTGVTNGIEAGVGGATSAASAHLNGLSAPQILAVAVGSVAFIALAILALWCLCRRRARTRELRKTHEREMDARALLARNAGGARSEVELKQPHKQAQQAQGMKPSQSQQSWKSFEAGQLSPPRANRGDAYAQQQYAQQAMPMPAYGAPQQQSQPQQSYAHQQQQRWSGGAGYAL